MTAMMARCITLTGVSRPSSHEEAAVPFPIFAGNISGGHDMQTMTNDIYHRSRLIGP
jgi:hypothetical protein